jgi:hypothetical protein
MGVATIGGSRNLHPPSEGATDLVCRILLDEVNTRDRHLGLVRPPAAELALLTNEDRPRFGVHEQLRKAGRREPAAAVVDDRNDDVGLPWRKTIGSPSPSSAYAISDPSTSTRLFSMVILRMGS